MEADTTGLPVPPPGDPGLRATALDTLGRLLVYRCAHAAAEAALQESVALSRAAGDEASAAWSTGTIALSAFFEGRLDEAADLAEDAVATAHRGGGAVGPGAAHAVRRPHRAGPGGRGRRGVRRGARHHARRHLHAADAAACFAEDAVFHAHGDGQHGEGREAIREITSACCTWSPTCASRRR